MTKSKIRRDNLSRACFDYAIRNKCGSEKVALSRRVLLTRGEWRYLIDEATARKTSLSSIVYEIIACAYHHANPLTEKPFKVRPSTKQAKEWDTKLNAFVNDLGGDDKELFRGNVLLQVRTWRKLLSLFWASGYCHLSEFVRALVDQAQLKNYENSPDFERDINKTLEIASSMWGTKQTTLHDIQKARMKALKQERKRLKAS